MCNHLTKLGGHSHCGSGDTTYLICHITLQDHDRIFWIYRRKLFIVCNNPPKFDAIVVVEIRNLFNSSCDLMWPHAQGVVWLWRWNLLIVSHQFSRFGGHRPFGSRDITDLIFQVTFHDYMNKGSCNFLEGRSSLYILSCQVW